MMYGMKILPILLLGSSIAYIWVEQTTNPTVSYTGVTKKGYLLSDKLDNWVVNWE